MPIIELYPEPARTLSDRFGLNFNIDILPADLAANRFTHWMPRLKVDGTEVFLRDEPITVDEDENSIGKTLTFSLLKVSDKSLMTSDASVDFGIGQRIAGVWDESTFVTLMSGAKVQSVNETIEGPPNNPKDRVSVTITSAGAEKLNTTSETGTIIYDPNRVTVSESDFKTIYDKDGQAYSPEVIAVPNLDLAYLFNYVFVTKCGFDSYQTDLPADDYPIERFDVPFGGRFCDGLKSFIGMYGPPAYRIEGNTIGVWDTTIPHPSGFPAPKEITLDVVANQLNLSQEKLKLDALMLHFIGVEYNYDEITVRHDDSNTTPSKNTTVATRRSIMEFRKFTLDGGTVVVHEVLWIEDKTTTINGTDSEIVSESYEFDTAFEVAARQKFTRSRLPNLDGTTSATVQSAENEREKFLVQAHPYKPRSRYVARRELQRDGLITVDADNPDVYGNPAKQAAKIADRSNNTADGQTYEWGSLAAEYETAEPLKDTIVRVRIFKTDEVKDQVTLDKTEIRAGEIGINGRSSQEQVMPVFAVDNATRSLEQTQDFYVGPLPLKYALPLAKRVLVNKQTKNQDVTLPVIGYDPSLRKDFAIAPKDRDGVSLGNFLIKGVSITISSQGLLMNLTARELADTDDPLQEISSTSNSIASGAVQTYTIPVDCADGRVLTLDPRPIADLTIEAKRSADSVWVDFETTDIDLSPWDGTTQDFDIRVTAGAVSVLTNRQFVVADDPA
jgi:hypothetical protein